MKASEVNEVINNICEKLGIGLSGVKELVPELAKSKIVGGFCWSFLCAIIIILGIWILITINKRMTNNEYTWDWFEDIAVFFTVFISIVIILCMVGLLVNLVEAIQWIAAPKAKAIEYIINLAK